MGLSFLLDENTRGRLWRAVQRHNARQVDPIDVLRVGDPPDLPFAVDDPFILRWAEREMRILVSFDKSTLPDHLANHLSAGHHSPGILMIRRRSNPASVLSFLVAAAYASDPSEWRDRIEYIG